MEVFDPLGLTGGEQWEPVPVQASGGEPFPYQVSDQGRVWSGHSEAILTPNPGQAGRYLIVDLRLDGEREQRSVHTLVLEAFEGPPPDGQEANHIDGDPKNNALENLEYVDTEDNRGEKVGEDDSFVTVEESAPF
jgi:hypothetical protein